MWCNVQVRGLTRALKSFELLLLPGSRVFPFEDQSPVHNRRALITQCPWHHIVEPQLGSFWTLERFLSSAGANTRQQLKKHPQMAALKSSTSTASARFKLQSSQVNNSHTSLSHPKNNFEVIPGRLASLGLFLPLYSTSHKEISMYFVKEGEYYYPILHKCRSVFWKGQNRQR